MNATRPGAVAAFTLLAMLGAGGCRLHMSGVHLNGTLTHDDYQAVSVGVDQRREVLARLGPPDRVRYTPGELIFDYEAASHRGTDLRFFFPSDVLPGINPLFALGLPRFFFDLFEEPDVFDATTMEAAGRRSAQGAAGLVPFTRGEDLLILRGRQLRRDRLRIVLDRASGSTRAKALRLATGEYAQESLADRVLLRCD